MINFENIIEPGVQFNGSLRLVGDSIISGAVNGDVVCIGRDSILYLAAGSSVSGTVTGEVVVAAGVVNGGMKAKKAIYKVDGCALGDTQCQGQEEEGSCADVFMKSHALARQPEIDEDAIIRYAVHQHCTSLHAGRAVIFEDGVERPDAKRGLLSKLKINLFKS